MIFLNRYKFKVVTSIPGTSSHQLGFCVFDLASIQNSSEQIGLIFHRIPVHLGSMKHTGSGSVWLSGLKSDNLPTFLHLVLGFHLFQIGWYELLDMTTWKLNKKCFELSVVHS